MTSAHLRLSRVSTGIAIAFALGAAPAAAAGYLKLGNVDGDTQGRGGQIIVESWSFGARQPAVQSGLGSWSKAEGLEVDMGQSAGAKGGNVEFEWKVEEGESAPPRPTRPTMTSGVEREMKESGEKGGTEDINIGVGELQEATGRRTHKPVRIVKEWDASTPMLRQGSMTTLVPAGTCRLGARYPTAELGTGNRVYRMTNVVVSSCSASGSTGGDARPMESLSLNYEKIVWR